MIALDGWTVEASEVHYLIRGNTPVAAVFRRDGGWDWLNYKDESVGGTPVDFEAAKRAAEASCKT